MQRAIVLLVHGSKDPQWLHPFEQIVSRARAISPSTTVRLAVMEPESTLAHTVSKLASEGVTGIEIVAGLLSSGGRHRKHDVPALLDQIRAQNPSMGIALRDGALGDHARVVDAIAQVLVAP